MSWWPAGSSRRPKRTAVAEWNSLRYAAVKLCVGASLGTSPGGMVPVQSSRCVGQARGTNATYFAAQCHLLWGKADGGRGGGPRVRPTTCTDCAARRKVKGLGSWHNV